MINALSVDLEDWFCAYNLRIDASDWPKQELRVVESTRRILDLLDKHDVKATFFVLGWFAEHTPDLVREVAQSGHEIASHGYSHTLLTAMTPEEFAADLKTALHFTRECVEQPILGFRAPSFTVTRKTLWALDILAEHGFQYDSSIFPIGFHPDYGMDDADLSIHRIGPITEVPMSVAQVFGRNVPCSGGGYFRLLPYTATRLLIRQCNRQGRPVIFYIHPWEVDPAQPHRDLPRMKSLRHYTNLDKTLGRFDRLLREFRFTPIRKVLGL